MMNRDLFRGFTLTEMMVVIAIISILAAVGYPMYTSHVRVARANEGRVALAQLKAKLEVYRSTNFTYTDDLTLIPGYDAEPYAYNDYYQVEIISADARTFEARAWDGIQAIGGGGTGGDEWRINEDLDEPCHTIDGTGRGDVGDCAAEFEDEEGA